MWISVCRVVKCKNVVGSNNRVSMRHFRTVSVGYAHPQARKLETGRDEAEWVREMLLSSWASGKSDRVSLLWEL